MQVRLIVARACIAFRAFAQRRMRAGARRQKRAPRFDN
jgi:hypothetical protein